MRAVKTKPKSPDHTTKTEGGFKNAAESRGKQDKNENMKRVNYFALSGAILHFKQLVDLSSQACRCNLNFAAVPAVI